MTKTFNLDNKETEMSHSFRFWAFLEGEAPWQGSAGDGRNVWQRLFSTQQTRMQRKGQAG